MPELVGAAVAAGRLRARGQPILQVDELTLRPWRLADVAGVIAAYQDPEIQRWHVRSMTEAEARRWVASWSEHWSAESGAGWAVSRDGVLVGRMGFRSISLEEGRAEADAAG